MFRIISSTSKVLPIFNCTVSIVNDTIIVNKEIIEDKIIIKLCSENNITYAIVEFSYNL